MLAYIVVTIMFKMLKALSSYQRSSQSSTLHDAVLQQKIPVVMTTHLQIRGKMKDILPSHQQLGSVHKKKQTPINSSSYMWLETQQLKKMCML